MKRTHKLSILTKVLQGNASNQTIKRLLQPVPLSVGGVLILRQAEPLADDQVTATFTYSGSRQVSQVISYQTFTELPESTQKTLFILPNNQQEP